MTIDMSFTSVHCDLRTIHFYTSMMLAHFALQSVKAARCVLDWCCFCRRPRCQRRGLELLLLVQSDADG